MALFTLSVWGVLSCGIGASFSPSFLVLGFVFTSLCAFLVRCSNPSTDTNDTMMPEMPEMPEFLDAFVVNNGQNRIYINNGMGGFPDAGITTLTRTNDSRAVALGDLDGDGNLDAFVANHAQVNRIYINNGMGGFPDAGITTLTGTNNSLAVALGDLDNDGNLDAFVGNNSQVNRVYINNGVTSGVWEGFEASAAPLTGTNDSVGVALGDLDNDGDLDAFVANSGQTNRIYINDGMGGFPDADITVLPNIGVVYSSGVALGDLDGDGNLDAFAANFDGVNHIYMNNGVTNGAWEGFEAAAPVSSSTERHDSLAVALGDLDGDGNLDAFVVNRDQPNRIYINNGMGGFPATGITVLTGANNSRAVALGDLDNDGDLDAFVGNRDQPNRIYINNGTTNDVWGGFADSVPLNGTNDSRGVALGELGAN